MAKSTVVLAPLPSLPRSAKSRAPRSCACGCTLLTRGGSFVPGHDSRRLGWAIRLWTGASVEGITPGERAAAIAFIAAERASGRSERFVGEVPSGLTLPVAKSA